MHIFDVKVLNANPVVYLSSSVYSTWPRRSGYSPTYTKQYAGSASAVIKRPIVKGADSAFTSSFRRSILPTHIQFATEPIHNNRIVFVYDSDNEDDSVVVKYLQNGVYLISYKEERVRIVAPTGPVSIQAVPTPDELFIVLNNSPIRFEKVSQGEIVFEIAPNGGIAYDKVICDADVDISEILIKDVKNVNGPNGIFMAMSRDKWYESKIEMAETMFSAEGYRVTSRGLTLTNTTVAFYSDLDQIEKSTDAENWEPVSALEFHGEDQILFRSKDPDFALEYFDTNMTDFIVPGATTQVTGEVYKVGNNIGTIFSHDAYRIRGGSFRIESDALTSVSILGKLPESVTDQFNPVIDFDGTAPGNMHLYTFDAESVFEISAEELIISGIGINMDHEDLMNGLCSRVEMSYADEIDSLVLGQSRNGDSEYAILDLQWNV